MTETRERKPQFGRVFDAAVSHDWLITEDAFRTILAVASRTNPMQAVEAFQSEQLQDTRTVKVRDGVAIIPVTGPISRYMTWFSAFSGGTSISVLGRDFQTALDDPTVYSIMFEINSPGGEVTGVNEFAQMVYRGRKVKPITARVGGLGCSAAYWIAAMCGDIPIDETAQLGSIGVMAVYMDDRKNLEMNGLEEIEFISSQSPYKNAAPYTDEGRKRIQQRIDAIADRFYDCVAVGRGVSKKDALANFGQGDVFVGKAAIDAGLADRFGSYEDTIRLLAKTHTPGFIDLSPDPEPFPDNGDPDDEYSSEKTINLSAPVNFQSEHEADETAAIDSNKKEEPMSEENKDLNSGAAGEPAADTTASQQAAPAATAAAPAKEPAPAAKTESADSAAASQTEDIAALKQQLAESQKVNLESSNRIAALEQAATDKWISEQVSGLAGETAAHTTILGALVTAHGQDSAEVKAYTTNQKALTAQLKAGGFFSELGKGGAETNNSPEMQIEAKAKDLLEKDPDVTTIQQARDKAYEQNPDLYKALREG